MLKKVLRGMLGERVKKYNDAQVVQALMLVTHYVDRLTKKEKNNKND